MTSTKLVRLLSLSGIIAAVFYFLHLYFGIQNYPNYSSLSQAVSDLTATDSPSFVIASRFSSLYALFSVLGCTMLCLIVTNQINKTFSLGIYLYAIMNLVSSVGYSLFPLSSKGFQGTFQDSMHVVVTFTVVLLSIISLIIIFIGGRQNKDTKGIAFLGIISLLLMFFGSIGMSISPKEYFGVFERFSVFSVVIYTALLGVFGFTYKNSQKLST